MKLNCLFGVVVVVVNFKVVTVVEVFDVIVVVVGVRQFLSESMNFERIEMLLRIFYRSLSFANSSLRANFLFALLRRSCLQLTCIEIT